MNRILLLSILLLALPTALHAQKNLRITARDEANIRNGAIQTMERFRALLMFVTEPDQSELDIATAIEHNFEADQKIFFSSGFKIEDDSEPHMMQHGQGSILLRDYLLMLRQSYKRAADQHIRFSRYEVSRVYQGARYAFVQVAYQSDFEGKNVHGQAYRPRQRIAELQVVPSGRQWRLYINALHFPEPESRLLQLPLVPVTDEAPARPEAAFMDAGQAGRWMARAEQALRAGRFTDAYFAFREAAHNPGLRQQAGMQIQILKNTLRARQLDVNTILYDSLLMRAAQQEQRGQLHAASRCLAYALDCLPDNNHDLPRRIAALQDRIQSGAHMEALLHAGLVQEAFVWGNAALRSDPSNPMLLLGMARYYSLVQDSQRAFYYLQLARAPDSSAPEPLQWLAAYARGKSNFTQALLAYTTMLSQTELLSDAALLQARAGASFCRGMLLYERAAYREAADTLAAAARLQPELCEAWLYQGLSHYQLRDARAALSLIRKALELKPAYAEAHYQLGRILESYHSRPSDNFKDEAIRSLKEAIRLEPAQAEWYYFLAGIEADQQYWEDAANSYTAFLSAFKIVYNPALRADVVIAGNRDTLAHTTHVAKAFWGRGRCHYYRGNYPEALADMERYRQLRAQRGLELPAAFVTDYGFALLKAGQFQEAIRCFEARKTDPEACLGMGIALYYTGSQASASWFERAFQQGVAASRIRHDADIAFISHNNRAFRSLLRKYHLNWYQPE